jgi:hypothetical protein
MKTICARLEPWILYEGTYPPLHKGDNVRLALAIEQAKVTKTKQTRCFFRQNRLFEYSFRGKVICNPILDINYEQSGKEDLMVIDTGGYIFFLEYFGRNYRYPIGQYLEGKGQIALDYFIWESSLSEIENAPEIYNNFLIDSILAVTIPKNILYESTDIQLTACSADATKISDEDIKEVMVTEEEYAWFYILNLSKTGNKKRMT